MLKDGDETYGSVTRWLHWGMGLMLIGMLVSGFIMTRLDPADIKWLFYRTHKAFGVILLLLIFVRLWWRLINPPRPALPGDMPAWQERSAMFNILFLYLCMIIMPLSGFLMSSLGGRAISMFGLFEIPSIMQQKPLAGASHTVHIWLSYAMAGAVSLHIIGGLYHHFVRKDDVLKKMLKGS